MSVKRIFYSTIVQSAGKIISAIVGIMTIAIMSRHLGKTGFGEYTTIVSFMGFFSVLADLGLYLVMTKRISRTDADEKTIIGNVLTLRFASALGFLVIGAFLALFFPYSRAVKEGMFLAIIAFSCVSGIQVLSGIFQKYLIISQFVIAEIIQRLLMLILVALLIWWHCGLRQFVLAFSLSSAVHFAISLWLALRLIAFRPQFDFAFWMIVLRESWPLAISSVLSLIYFRADTLILSVSRSAADVGIYGLPRKVMEVLLVFPALFSGLMMPFLARFAYSDWKNYRLYLQKSLDAIYLSIVPMAMVTVFFARPIIDLLGGSDYRNADSVLQILIFSTSFIYVGLLLGYVTVALGAQREMLWGNCIGSLCGLGLYIWLIPRFNYIGAAASTVVVHIIVCLYAYLLTSRKSHFYPSFSTLGKALLAAVPAVFFYRWVTMEWIAELTAGLAIYFLMLLALRAIPLEFIREVFSQNDESLYASGSNVS